MKLVKEVLPSGKVIFYEEKPKLNSRHLLMDDEDFRSAKSNRLRHKSIRPDGKELTDESKKTLRRRKVKK